MGTGQFIGTESSSIEASDLPSFANPPVIETVLGVQFDPVLHLSNAHLGAFWKFLGDEWPEVSDAPKLEPEFEVFDTPIIWQNALQIRLGQDPAARVQIRNKNRTRMIQVQNGRLIYNWIAQADEEYPSYGKIRPEFDKTLKKFSAFMQDNNLGPLLFNQWEVTYVNHIPQGTAWSTPDDWSSLFRAPILIPDATAMPAKLVGISGELHYEIEPNRGRLHIQLIHGREAKEPPREILVLKLTARGTIKPEDSNLSLDGGLNLGHAIIVRSFAALASPEAHAIWRRQQ